MTHRQWPGDRAAMLGRATTLVTLAVASTACELREVTIAEPDEVIVAEVVLIAESPVQRAVLHRTRGTGAAAGDVRGASIWITGESGTVLTMTESATPSACFVDEEEDRDDNDESPGTCYWSLSSNRRITPGQRYELQIDLPDGRRLTGTTTVPQPFRLLAPADPFCALSPDSTLEVMWTASEGAWVYAAETELRGLSEALESRGVELRIEPLRLFGLALSRTDTTIVFPGEFGLFDRFDPNLTDALGAIQGGLPPNVEADVVIAAADRNYVNWERGGNFNPSGFVRVPSVFGDGTGVFGSIVPRSFTLTTQPVLGVPRC